MKVVWDIDIAVVVTVEPEKSSANRGHYVLKPLSGAQQLVTYLEQLILAFA